MPFTHSADHAIGSAMPLPDNEQTVMRQWGNFIIAKSVILVINITDFAFILYVVVSLVVTGWLLGVCRCFASWRHGQTSVLVILVVGKTYLHILLHCV